jgi:hypothetical protein
MMMMLRLGVVDVTPSIYVLWDMERALILGGANQ